MPTILRINKKNYDAIVAGTKKSEWRQVSKYNKGLLLRPRLSDGLLEGNPDIKEVLLIAGYANDSPRVTVGVEFIRPCKFSRDVVIPEDDFKALAGQVAIEIRLSPIKI